MFKKLFPLLLIVLTLAFTVFAASAHEGEHGKVRLVNFIMDADPMMVYVNGEAFMAEGMDTPAVFPAGRITDYMDMEPGTYSLVFAPQGASLDEAMMEPVEMEVVADHAYSTILYGQMQDESADVLKLDETQAAMDAGLEQAVTPVILFQGISEVPAVDIYAADSLFLENIPFGDFRYIEFPLSVVPITITVHGDKDSVVLVEDFFGVPNTLALAALVGSYPDNYTRIIRNTTDLTAFEFFAGAKDSPVVSFNSLVSAITVLATSGVELPETMPDSTFFAPTDAAFAALPEGALDDLLANPDMLRDVLLYHGVQGPLYAWQIVGGVMESGSFTVASALGQDLVITPNEKGLIINDSAQLIYVDVRTADGIVHIIDHVLMPAMD